MISVVVVSKDEPDLDSTLSVLEAEVDSIADLDVQPEILVVDASEHRLDAIRQAHPRATWIDFKSPAGVGVTIARQRNVGVREARGDVVVFTDSGSSPQPGWLHRLVEDIVLGGESVVAGSTRSLNPRHRLYGRLVAQSMRVYIEECPTVNLAIRREALDDVGAFDEAFRYGSDVDLSWRLRDAGYCILHDPYAVVDVDWGNWRRQLRRSFAYGRARVDLYRKHPHRIRRVLHDNPVVVIWPLYLLGLPIAIKRPSYLLLLAIPAWRARHEGPVGVLVDHAVFGAGVLRQLAWRP